MITFLMLVAWVFLAIYCPKIFYGYSWEQLQILMEDKEIQSVSKLMQELGITDENITQKASKQYYTCIAIVIGSLILIFVIRKLLKLLDQYIVRKNKVADAEANQKIKSSNYGITLSRNDKINARAAVRDIISSNHERTPEENIEIINQLAYLDDEEPKRRVRKNQTNKEITDIIEEVPEVESIPETKSSETDNEQ